METYTCKVACIVAICTNGLLFVALIFIVVTLCASVRFFVAPVIVILSVRAGPALKTGTRPP